MPQKSQSVDYAGAALLVCRAAGRAGAGLVTLAVPESLQPLFAAKVVEAGGRALVAETTEMMGGESLIQAKAKTPEIARKILGFILIMLIGSFTVWFLTRSSAV